MNRRIVLLVLLLNAIVIQGCDSPAATPAVPGIPTHLIATPDRHSVGVVWAYAGDSKDFFILQYQHKGDSSWTAVTIPLNTFTHSDLNAGFSYSYRVQECNAIGCSPFSSETSVTLPPPLVTASAALVGWEVRVNWQYTGDDGANFWRVERLSPQLTLSVGEGTTNVERGEFADATFDVLTAHTYRYRVQVCSNAGCTISDDIPVSTPALLAPTNLSASAQVDRAVLTWQDNSTETEFILYRRSLVFGEDSVSLPANTTAYADTSALGVTRYYQLRAKITNNEDYGVVKRYSLRSTEVEATPGITTTAPPTAVTLPATDVQTTSAVINQSIIANGLPTLAWFEWTSDSTFTTSHSTNAGQSIGSGNYPIGGFDILFSLTPRTTYYVRAVASNSAGTSRGSVIMFTTGPP